MAPKATAQFGRPEIKLESVKNERSIELLELAEVVEPLPDPGVEPEVDPGDDPAGADDPAGGAAVFICCCVG